MKEDITNKEAVSTTKEDTNKQPETTKKPQAPKADDTVFTYCYILSTLEQRKALDLTKHKEKMIKTISSFFAERLISVEIFQNNYFLKLKDEYDIGSKRRLGRILSANCGFTQYSKKVNYNNNKDLSTQLFRVCKEKDKLNDK